MKKLKKIIIVLVIVILVSAFFAHFDDIRAFNRSLERSVEADSEIRRAEYRRIFELYEQFGNEE